MGHSGPCEACLQAKVKRHAVPKMTDKRANMGGKRFFVDMGGPRKHSSLGGNIYIVIFVDSCTRFKVVKFIKKKIDTTTGLLSFIVDYTIPHELSIKCMRADNDGGFVGVIQRELDQRSITHEHTSPETPLYKGVAERALGLLGRRRSP